MLPSAGRWDVELAIGKDLVVNLCPKLRWKPEKVKDASILRRDVLRERLGLLQP